MVIAVNGWMNHPTGFRLVDGKAVDVHPLHGAVRQQLLLARARPHVPRRLHRHRLPRRRRLRRRRGCAGAGAATSGRRSRSRSPSRRSPRRAGPRRRLERARRRRRRSRRSSPRSRGSARRRRARRCTSSAGTATARSSTGSAIPQLLSLLAFHDPNATVQGLDAVPPADRPPVNVVRFAFQTMVGIGTLLALLARRLSRRARPATSGCRSRSGSTGRSSPPGRSRSSR